MLFRRIQHPSQADLSAYVDGELAVVQARSVAAHAETCAECREALEGLRETKALLAGLPRAMLPRSFVLSAAQAGLLAARPTTSRPSALRFAPALSLAALAVLLLVDVSLPSGSGDSSATRDDFRAGLAAKSSAESADSASRPALPAAPSAAAIAPSPLPRAANSDGGVVGATGPAAAAPPPAIAPLAAGQVAPSGQAAPQMDTQAQPAAPSNPSQQESRSAAPEPPPAIAIQPSAATPGSDGGAAGAAAAPSPTTGGAVPGPSQPQQPAVTASEDDGEDTDRTLLRLFEVLAAAAFLVSLLVAFWPRLTRKEP
jgi:hypothetical protein